jgi:hypothetical protein
MKTENYDNDTISNGNALRFNRLANSPGARSTPSLQRLSITGLNKPNELKERVTEQLVGEYGTSVNATLLSHAVREADAIAATTLFPNLFLPVLAEEKVRSASAWSNRQRMIRQQTLALAA